MAHSCWRHWGTAISAPYPVPFPLPTGMLPLGGELNFRPFASLVLPLTLCPWNESSLCRRMFFQPFALYP